MIGQKPYLIRAMYEWILDNGWTPYVQVDARWPGVVVPRQFVGEDGSIVLNIGPAAVRSLELDNDAISFFARFQGKERQVYFPPEAVIAIFSKETGYGMPFPEEPYPEEGDAQGKEASPSSSTSAAGRDEEENENKVIAFDFRRRNKDKK